MAEKSVIVIGSGFAGLSAASFMAKAGWEVTVIEKNDTAGGRARQWKEKGFTFDYNTGECCWYKQPVDLVQICDKCLAGVNEAIVAIGKQESVHHIEAAVRKGAIRNMRNQKRQMPCCL